MSEVIPQPEISIVVTSPDEALHSERPAKAPVRAQLSGLSETNSEGLYESGYSIILHEGYSIIEPGNPVEPVHPHNPKIMREEDLDLTWQKEYFATADAGDDRLILMNNTAIVAFVRIETQAHVLVRTREAYHRIVLPGSDFNPSTVRRVMGKGTSKAAIAKRIAAVLQNKALLRNLVPIDTHFAVPALLKMDSLQVYDKFKFGLMYCRDGQTDENQILANNAQDAPFSDAYETFLDLLGDRVKLHGWDKFRAGLDAKHGTTGEESLYTETGPFSIMFHVCTMLPFRPTDPQQLERKRHIGNDIVVIVFKDGREKYHPTTLVSKQTHVIIVVSPDHHDDDQYRVEVVVRKGTPEFGPHVPLSCCVPKMLIRDFVLFKAINGERAAYNAPEFHRRVTGVRAGLFQGFAEAVQSAKKK